MPRKDLEARRAYRQERKLLHHAEILAQGAKSREKNRATTREKDAARREANRERIREHDRAAYAANPEPKKATSRQRHTTHKEEISLTRKAKNAANPLPNRARAGRWQAANRQRKTARDQANRALNPAKHRMRNGRRRARVLSLPDTWTFTEEAYMSSYWGYACAACGNQEGVLWKIVGDHWIPLASLQCPGTVAHNMIPLCQGKGGCNNSKGKTEPGVWLLARFGHEKAQEITQLITAYFTEVQRRFPLPQPQAS